MAIHSSTLAWKIPWMEEPDRLLSMGSQRVGHDWATSLSLSYTMEWASQVALGVKNPSANAGDIRDKGWWGRSPGGRHSIPLLPGESHGQRSLVDHSPWGHKESDTTEVT